MPMKYRVVERLVEGFVTLVEGFERLVENI